MINQGNSELAKLIRTGVKKNLSKKELLFNSDQQQRLTIVESGFVKRYLIKADGSIGVQSIYSQNSIFPLTHIYKILYDIKLSESDDTYYYEAMTPSQVYMLSDETLLSELDKRPELYKDLLRVCGKRLQSNIRSLENQSLPVTYQKVAHQLYALAQEYGVSTAAGVKIGIAITQQDIADIISTTRETVSTCISQLRKKKLVLTFRGKFIVPDMQKLLDEVNV